jgi:hypothetical protein
MKGAKLTHNDFAVSEAAHSSCFAFCDCRLQAETWICDTGSGQGLAVAAPSRRPSIFLMIRFPHRTARRANHGRRLLGRLVLHRSVAGGSPSESKVRCAPAAGHSSPVS